MAVLAAVRIYRLTPPQIAAFFKMPVLSIDYRMAPDHPAPAAMDDTIDVWREVLKTHKPANVVLGGTSAGGTLTLVATLRMKELGLALPAALFVGTPAADLAKRGDMRFINNGIDHVLVGWERVKGALALYVGDQSYDEPYISPIFGDFKGFPPTYLISGTRDLMLSDTARTHRKLRQAGVEADLHVYEGVAHADYAAMADTLECAEHYAELNAFIPRHLAQYAKSPAMSRCRIKRCT
jgi:monoterpene epsilon-lactone hydrolase